MKLTVLFKEFFFSEKAGGLILVFATIISLLVANSSWQTAYVSAWQTVFAGHSIVFWINEGLMAIFFLLIGLELEREIYHGELSDLRNAALPMFGALGGMLMPALVYLLFNFGLDTQSGLGIPMATDIAFAIGILSLLGNKVPASLKIFLIALAVMDDMGAIIMIAIFYTTTVVFTNLLIVFVVFGFLLLLNKLNIKNLVPYIAGGLVMWYFMSISGVHPTLTGVMLAFAIPFRDGSVSSPSSILQHALHWPVAFFIMPLFALANTSIIIGDLSDLGLGSSSSIGIIAGLFIGKPLGILFFSYLGVVLGLCVLPIELKWSNILGAGFLGGIGFTMSIFITMLAFDSPELINISKIAILVASVLSAITGLLFLKWTLKKPFEDENL